MFYYCNSNETELLTKLTSGIIRNSFSNLSEFSKFSKSVFYKDFIITENVGLRNFISQSIANENSVATSIEYKPIWSYLWLLVVKLYIKDHKYFSKYLKYIDDSLVEQKYFIISELDPFNKDSMFLSILYFVDTVLPNINYRANLSSNDSNVKFNFNVDKLLSDDEYKEVLEYFDINEQEESQTFKRLTDYLDNDIVLSRRFDISEAIAHMFGKYQLIRPNWIEQWTKNDFNSWIEFINLQKTNSVESLDVKDYKWIAILWAKYVFKNIKSQHEVLAETQSKSSLEYVNNVNEYRLDKSKCIQCLIDVLKNAKRGELTEKIGHDRIIVYGLVVNSLFQEVLFYLSRHIDVYAMILNPSEQYWGDIQKNTYQNLLEHKTKLKVKSKRFEGNLDNSTFKFKEEERVIIEAEDIIVRSRDNIVDVITSEDKNADDANEIKNSNKPNTMYKGFLDYSSESMCLIDSNPLLYFYGKLGATYHAEMLKKISDYQEDEKSDILIEEISAFFQPKPINLLNKIKSDIFYLRNSDSLKKGCARVINKVNENIFKSLDLTLCDKNGKWVNNDNEELYSRLYVKNDKSVQIYAAPNIIREVQNLYDNILDILTNDPSVTFNDIVVVIPKIKDYIPTIKGVFDECNASLEQSIKYVICDKDKKEDNSLVKVFLDFLTLCSLDFLNDNSNFGNSDGNEKQLNQGYESDSSIKLHDPITIEKILKMLSIEAIGSKFNISSNDIESLSNLIANNNMIMGIENSDTQSIFAEFNVKPLFSLEDGLSRYLSGLLFPSEIGNSSDFNTSIEGNEISQLLGNFYMFYENLKDFRNILKKQLKNLYQIKTIEEQWTPKKWIEFIDDNIITRFFNLDFDEVKSLQKHIKITLSNLNRHYENGVINKPRLLLPYLIGYLNKSWKEQNNFGQMLSGKISFCTFVPMRSIQYRYVFMLGMDDGKYPRTMVENQFDLMAKYPQYQDRLMKDDDSYIFLENLLLAQDRLYISYQGMDAATGTTLNPSSLVTLLQNYIYENFVYCECSKPNLLSGYNLEKGKDFNEVLEFSGICTDYKDNENKIRQSLVKSISNLAYDLENFRKGGDSSFLKQYYLNDKIGKRVENEYLCNGVLKDFKLGYSWYDKDNKVIDDIVNFNNTKVCVINLDLKQLIEFTRDQAKYFYTKVLNLKSFSDFINTNKLQTTEVYSLNEYEKNKIKVDLLNIVDDYLIKTEAQVNTSNDKQIVNDQEYKSKDEKLSEIKELVNNFLNVYEKKHIFPLSYIGEKIKLDICDEILYVADALISLKENDRKPLVIDMSFDIKIEDQDFINSLKHFDKSKDILRVNLTGTFEELYGNTFVYSNLFHSDYKFNIEVMLKIIYLCVHLENLKRQHCDNADSDSCVNVEDNVSLNTKTFDLENIVLLKTIDKKLVVSNINDYYTKKLKEKPELLKQRFNSYKSVFGNEGKTFLEKFITSFLIGNIKPFAAFNAIEGIPKKIEDVLLDNLIAHLKKEPLEIIDNSYFDQSKIMEIMNEERTVLIPSFGHVDLSRNYSYLLYKDNTFYLSDFYGYEELLKMSFMFSFFLENKIFKVSKSKK